MFGDKRSVVVGSLIVLSCLALLTLDRLSFEDLQQPSSLLQLSSAPLPGHSIHVELPVSQLKATQVGDTVQGKVLAQNGGYDQWSGTITADTDISPQQGCVTVKVISDRYIAPGTPVSGTVGGAGFMGQVVGSPNNQQRVSSIERRLEALEPRAHDRVAALERKLDRMHRKLRKIEGHKDVKQRMEELEKRVIELEKRPPSKNALMFGGNVAGFHFLGAIGTRGLAPRIDKIDARLSAIEARPKPDEAVKPVQKRIEDLNKRLSDLTDEDGIISYKQQMSEMEKRLCALEKLYGGGGGDNSKWYGTEEYHGLYKNPNKIKTDVDDFPAGNYHHEGV